MTPRRLLMCAALAATAAAGLAQAADVGGRPLYAALTGAAEIPGPGDTDGAGTARITINPGKDQVCWDLTWSAIVTPTVAHIHVGDATTAGPPVVTLDPIASGCASADDELTSAILANPAGYYVNIHNADFPAGAIRGQLSLKKMK